jgi:carbamoyltransferase
LKIAGLWSGHDCSFCILEDGMPTIHAELERYIREKEPVGDSISFLKEYDFDEFNNIKYFASCFPTSKLENYQESYNELKNVIQKNNGKLFFVGHHEAHAANAFFSSNFNDAVIVTIDGGGVESPEGFVTSLTVFTGKDNKINREVTTNVHQINVGGLWTRATRYIFNLQSGWPRGHQAGTVMAMAAMGDPERFKDEFLVMLSRDLQIASMKPTDQPKGPNVGTDPDHPYLHKWRMIADQSEQNRFDLAASLQSATEEYLKNIFDQILDKFPNKKYLCLSGGVTLNSVFTGKLLEWYENRLDGVYVTPTPHDGGLSIGATQYVWHQILDNPRISWSDHCSPYLGEIYSKKDIEKAIESNSDKIKSETASIDMIVDLLDDQKIVSVFSKGSESGRRALGNRSILADPRSSSMKDMINEKVKHRQWFRPFAPSILAEEACNWFKQDIESPYMSFVVDFKDEVKDKVPAVVHLNGTARLQTVTKNNNEAYYNLLKKWHKKSGVPILLNTSFNDREPICETPDHAIDCFLRTNIDYLYFADYDILVGKK